MELVTLFFTALMDLSNAMAPYILFGLAFAGILHELVPDTIVTKHLGRENIGSVIKSTIFGIPLPVCSCGVIPLATSIKKSGASKGAVWLGFYHLSCFDLNGYSHGSRDFDKYIGQRRGTAQASFQCCSNKRVFNGTAIAAKKRGGELLFNCFLLRQ
jgi:hypothetical protein